MYQENDSMIVRGNLKNSKGIKFNRKLYNGFPYYRLSQFIKYKAKWLRIKIIKISKSEPSKLFHKCRSIGFRVGSFIKMPTIF